MASRAVRKRGLLTTALGALLVEGGAPETLNHLEEKVRW